MKSKPRQGLAAVKSVLLQLLGFAYSKQVTMILQKLPIRTPVDRDFVQVAIHLNFCLRCLLVYYLKRNVRMMMMILSVTPRMPRTI